MVALAGVIALAMQVPSRWPISVRRCVVAISLG
jgi:hypothetical protein